LIPVLTSTLHYNMFDNQSCLDVRLSWDHRVYDGTTAARALVDLESVLNREMVAEMNGMRIRKAA
jgi:pyruvate/2-oxoglutarate dehydrogenase complex dihydrolipoamide acyltransferase (E2) component